MPPTLFAELQEFFLGCLYDTLTIDVFDKASVEVDKLAYEVITLRFYFAVISVARHKKPHLSRRNLAGARFLLTAARVSRIFYIEWVSVLGSTKLGE